jgi:hypothetical protein
MESLDGITHCVPISSRNRVPLTFYAFAIFTIYGLEVVYSFSAHLQSCDIIHFLDQIIRAAKLLPSQLRYTSLLYRFLVISFHLSALCDYILIRMPEYFLSCSCTMIKHNLSSPEVERHGI